MKFRPSVLEQHQSKASGKSPGGGLWLISSPEGGEAELVSTAFGEKREMRFWKHAERADWVTHGPCLSASPGLIRPRGDLQMQGGRRRRDTACEERITERKSPFPQYNQKCSGTKQKAWKQIPPSVTPSIPNPQQDGSRKNGMLQCFKVFSLLETLEMFVFMTWEWCQLESTLKSSEHDFL